MAQVLNPAPGIIPGPGVNVNVNPGGFQMPQLMMPTTITANALTPNTQFFVPPIMTTLPGMTTLTTPSSMVLPSTIIYPDVNNDRDLRHQVASYFMKKILGNWLKYHFLDVYPLISISGGSPKLISDIKQEESNKDTKNNDLKYDFIVKEYINEHYITKLLNKYRKRNGVDWWDLKHFSDKIRKYIGTKLYKHIKHDIVVGKKD